MKSNKGITMISLVVTILLMVIISSTVIYYGVTGLDSGKLNNMYSDIDNIQNKINSYYATNKALPVLDKFTNTSAIQNIKNINDDDNYYVIDLSSLQGLTLHYGKDYYKLVDNTADVDSVSDIYIVNEKTHTVYYVKGVTLDDTTYYALNNTYTQIQLVNIENAPKLSEGMTPVKYIYTNEDIGEGYWQVTTQYDIEWYNYKNKMWANVMLNDGMEVDETGKVTTMGSMLVWIPRFAYQIESGYNSSTAGKINIKFLKDNTDIPVGEAEQIQDSTSGQGNWLVHPAFSYGGVEISGFWIGKFESSNQYCTTDVLTGQADYDTLEDPIIKILPSVTSWRNISVDNIYKQSIAMNDTYNMYGIDENVDTHMLKNSEWGAVVYLAQSSIGAEKQVWINPNSSFVTGEVGTEASMVGTATTYTYNTPNGIKTSSTGNITGVYDLNGCSYEYVAAYVDNADTALETNAQTLYTTAPAKHKDVYTKDLTDAASTNYSANSNIYGDAIYETSSSYEGSTSWYSSVSIMPATSNPFFARGSHFNNNTNSGLFAFEAYNGTANTAYSFRISAVIY